MITGPILPRTRAGLWSLLAECEERVERGLVTLQVDLQLDERVRVDALARDAMGHPVLLFAWLEGEDDDLPLRVLEALAWFQRNLPLLRETLVLPGLRVDLPPRAIVLGYDLAARIVDKLARLREPRLEAFEYRGFSAGGVHHVGVVPVLGPALTADEHSFRAPAGVQEPHARTLCTRFLARMQALDPALQVLGDRYARRLRLDGVLLVELKAGARGIELTIPAADGTVRALRVQDVESLDAACDLVLRRYLALLEVSEGADESPAEGGESGAAGVLARSAAGTELRRDVLLRRDSGTLERAGGERPAAELRQSVPEANLTKEELSALSGPLQ